MSLVLLIARGIIAIFTVLSLGGAIGGVEITSKNGISKGIEAAASFLATPSYNLFAYDRIVFIAILLFAVLVIVEHVINRNRPISVLATELRVSFIDGTGEIVRISRTQYLRANRAGVTGYPSESSTIFGGRLPRNSVFVNAFVRNARIPNHPEIPPTRGESRLEIMHEFDEGMPFGVWNVIVPEFILRLLVRQGVNLPFVVRRELTLDYVGEHTGPDTYYEATAGRYIQRNVKITIDFNSHRPATLDGGVLVGQLITMAGINKVPFRSTGPFSHECRFRQLRNERVRVPLRFDVKP